MLLLGERSETADQLSERLRILSDKLFESLPPGERRHLEAQTDLYALQSTENLFIVRSGTMQGWHGERLCLYFEPGDVIGLNECYQLPALRVACEEGVVVEQHTADDLLRYTHETKERQAIWTSFLMTQIALFQDAFARNLREEDQSPQTGFLNFAPGETILTEGDPAHEVFTILNGRADVYVAGSKVGEVLQDEIFGAMAVFTGEPRSATVIASEPCTVLAVPKDEFVTLIKSHPETTMTLIENMARNIQSLNARLTED